MTSRRVGSAARPTNSRAPRLAHYWAKRDFKKTSEPRGEQTDAGTSLSFVIQKHAASRLHYDFRLELDGVLLSWAVPKGPSYDPADKRLAVHVEDHPLSYGSFEGTIPAKQYGAGTVIVWDRGSWEPIGDPHEGLKKGKLAFRLRGQKMTGLWELVKIARNGERQEPWLLFKKRDEFARPRAEYDVVRALPDSVIAKPIQRAAADSDGTPQRRSVRSDKQRAKKNGMPAGSVRAVLPKLLKPQLATLTQTAPTEGQWIYEIKFDGYRIMARVDKSKVSLVTRGGHDWASKMPHLVRELKALGMSSAWLDGEIVVLGANGAPDFNALQKALDGRSGTGQVLYFLFDLPFFCGSDLREVGLVARRELLKSLLKSKQSDHLRYSEAFEADAASVLSSACAMHLEGVIAKRADAPYVSRRTETWLKLKCKRRQEFVVCGYVDRSDNSAQIGSLLLGVYDAAGSLLSVGKVGTGWDADEARRLKERLKKIHIDSAPYTAAPKKPGRWSGAMSDGVRWVTPQLVAEVEFAEWTPDNQIRHASYVALRKDKPAKSIVRETAKMAVSSTPSRAVKKVSSGQVSVTHGDRVIDPTTKLKKIDLVRYYESVSAWILPHLKGRPCSLVRGPAGVTGQLFFQKHIDKGFPGIRGLDASLWPGHAPLLEIDNAGALAGATQMNVIEFHTWNSTSKKIDLPDRMVFDLDPGAGVAWPHVQEAATLTRALLLELGLESWLKTSGGKGLHVVVPLAPRWNYATVKGASKAVVQHLAKTIPSRFVAKSGSSNRVGKVFVDYLRNGRGATTAAAFSARARPGLGVSMPLAWEELVKLKGAAQWTIANAREYLSFQKQDPWALYWKRHQSLTQAMKLLSFTP
jgi:bifunctional non-homologous end joining protein LigD